MSDWKIISFSGCSTQDLETDYSFTVQQAVGFGFPPVTNVSIPYGILDGDLFQRTRTEAQPFTLVGYIAGSSLADLFTLRNNLIGAVRPDRITPQEPVIIQFTGGTATIQASCYYDAGLELGNVQKFTELGIGLRFRVFNSIWESPTSSSITLAVQDTVASANYIVQRNTSGSWISLSSGMDGNVHDIVTDSDGLLYAAGNFETAGGTTACYVASWNDSTWFSLAGSLDGICLSMAVDFNDDVYVAGQYGIGDGIGNLSKWDSSASTFSTIGGSPTVSVSEVIIGNDGTVYIAGQFAAIATCSLSSIAQFDGLDWSDLGVGIVADPPTDEPAFGLTIGLDESLYVSGPFQIAGGITANYSAKWNPSTSAWSALGTGLDDETRTVATGPDGAIYYGGNFLNAGGNSANYIAKWDGNWHALGDGLDDQVKAIGVDSNGMVHIGGDFTKSGTFTFTDALSRWNGFSWLPVGINFSSTANVFAILTESDGTLTYGGNFSGSATTSAVTVVNNGGGGDAFPVLSCSGPGRLVQFVNFTTTEAIYFDLVLNNNEVVTLDLRVGAKSFESNTRGNIINKILPGSDLTAWRLSPGNNNVSLFIDDSSASATMTWSEVA